jgi:hypothetical protein
VLLIFARRRRAGGRESKNAAKGFQAASLPLTSGGGFGSRSCARVAPPESELARAATSPTEVKVSFFLWW